nr:hypothetical protein [Tanacetum cinerariifolium]
MATTINQQVALDESLVPSKQRAFQVTADIDTKKSVLDLEAFREMLHISLRIPNQSFADLPTEEEILNFLRQKSGDRHQPTTQQSSHRNHGHNNDRHGSDRRGGSDNHRSSNNKYSGNNNRLNFRSIRSSSTHKHDPNITVSSSPGVPLRVTPTWFALRVDADTQESVVELL